MSEMPAYLKKIDYANGVRFFSTCTEVLHRNHILPASRLQHIREFLHSISTAPVDSIWETATSHCELFPFLQARYAAPALSLNYFHFSIHPFLQDTIHGWGRFGIALSSKVDLLLNRPCFVYDQQGIEFQAAYANLLIELADITELGCKRLQGVRTQMHGWIPHSMAGSSEEDQAIDTQLATALGFARTESRILYEVAAASARRELLTTFGTLVAWVEAFLRRTGLFPEEATGACSLCWTQCRGIRSAIQMLDGISFPREVGLLEQEWVRKSFVEGYFQMHTHMEQLQQGLFTLLSGESETGSLAVPISRALERRLMDTLLREGTAPKEAGEALLALFAYCQTHEISPQEILPGELGHIHRRLSAESLLVLQKSTVPVCISVASPEAKQQLLAKAQTLLQRFTTYLALGVWCVGFWGCGVKTLPISDALELRPEIPFHSEQTPVKTKGTKEAPRETPPYDASTLTPEKEEDDTDEPAANPSYSDGRLDRTDHPL